MPNSLVEVLNDPSRRESVIQDSVTLLEAEVASKSGLRGAAVKAGYKALKKVKPGIVRAAISKLLPEFAPVMDPYYQKARETGDVRGYFTRESNRIADALLGVTDAKAQNADNQVMKKIYNGLRGQAQQHTAAAMPAVADLIERHVG